LFAENSKGLEIQENAFSRCPKLRRICVSKETYFASVIDHNDLQIEVFACPKDDSAEKEEGYDGESSSPPALLLGYPPYLSGYPMSFGLIPSGSREK
jgi:hypothetical protein